MQLVICPNISTVAQPHIEGKQLLMEVKALYFKVLN